MDNEVLVVSRTLGYYLCRHHWVTHSMLPSSQYPSSILELINGRRSAHATPVGALTNELARAFIKFSDRTGLILTDYWIKKSSSHLVARSADIRRRRQSYFSYTVKQTHTRSFGKRDKGQSKLLMTLLKRSERGCMRLGVHEGYGTRRQRKVVGILPGDGKRNRKEIREFQRFTKKEIIELLFDKCNDCEKMAAIPQGAFAASKVRRNHERGLMISQIEATESEGKENVFTPRAPLEGWELTPLKYNSKLMNSIWGLYNRYSVHNFKKNTDADEGVLAAVWEAVQNQPPTVNATVVAATTSTRIFGTGNGL